MEPLVSAALMGVVEGLTEFLPVSSTGHLILTGEVLGLTGPEAASFEIVIQLGAILAVLVLYRWRFLGLLGLGGTASVGLPSRSEQHATVLTPASRGFRGPRGIFLLALSTFPGAALGFFSQDIIRGLFPSETVFIALAVGAVLMLLVEEWESRRIKRATLTSSIDQLTWRQALGVGCFQCLALWPGFSRSASTIMGGMILGLKREVAAEYSFLAAVPLIVGVCGYEILKNLHEAVDINIPFFAVGLLFSFVSALLAIKTFIALLSRVTLRPFAIYRLLLAFSVYWFLVR